MGIRIGLCRPQADYVTTHSLALAGQPSQLHGAGSDGSGSVCYKADKELKT